MTLAFRARLCAAASAGLMLVGVLAAPALAAGRGTMTGTYTTDAGAPIRDAYVQVWDDDYTWLRDGNTDAQGRYTFRNVPAGPIRLVFQTNGIIQWAQRKLTYDAATTFTLGDGATLTVDEQQVPVGTLAGTVREPNGEPSVEYTATITRADDPLAVSSASPDENGRFAIDLPEGEYKLDLQRGAVQQWWPGKTDPAEAETIVVRAGQTTTADDTLLTSGSLGGTITTATGEPLVNAEVGLYRPGGDSPLALQWTAEDGTWAFPQLLPGRWKVAWRADGSDTLQWMHETTDPALATTFTVVGSEHTVADDRQVTNGSLSGKLVDTGGAPVAGVTVRAQVASDEWDEGREAVTQADGTWAIPGVRPAGYAVSFTKEKSNRTQWAYGKTTRDDAQLITVASGHAVTVDDTWLPGATLTVHPVDATTGAPVDGVCVMVSGPDTSDCAATGDLVVNDLAAGPAHLSFSTPDGSFYLSADAPREVTLTAGQNTAITVPLTLGGKVTASAVEAATGTPLRRACLVLIKPANGGVGDGGGECTNIAGKITTKAAAPGTYQVFVFAPEGYGHQWLGATGGTGEQKLAAKITVKPGKVARTPDVRLDKAGAITGTVTDENGAPLPGANVAYSAWGLRVGGSNDVETDEKGRYTIGRLGPYAWPLIFTTGTHPRQWSGNTANRNQAAAIAVTAGATAAYDIALQPGVPVTGTVAVAPGLPTARWNLTAFNAATGDQLAEFDGSEASDGGYRMAVLPGQQIKLGWSVYDDEAGVDQRGFYVDAVDLGSAVKIPVPRSGTVVDLVVGR
ncbi:carboxypeptidase regulatory-like domain-containing protein [Actinoplanes sp. NPDC089786]|uniref:MSCRAMM family protein n=1 Tax=Actinoplanes sp. NPDC089786 TaxID=3155185 RepID=UPI0034368310